GHLRKLVPELRQQVGIDQLRETTHAGHRHANAVIALVAVKRCFDRPLLPQQAQERLLTLPVELLRVQVHRVSRSTAIVHEPDRQRKRGELQLTGPAFARSSRTDESTESRSAGSTSQIG